MALDSTAITGMISERLRPTDVIFSSAHARVVRGSERMYQVVAKRNDTAAARGKMTRGRRSKSSAMAKRNDAQQLVRNIAVMV